MVCVSGVWAGVNSIWEQKKLEARKMLENGAESPASSARFVRSCCCFPQILLLFLWHVLLQDTEVLQPPHLMDTVYQ